MCVGGKPTEFVKDPDVGLWEAEESGSLLGVWIAQPRRWTAMPFADTEMPGREQVREESRQMPEPSEECQEFQEEIGA